MPVAPKLKPGGPFNSRLATPGNSDQGPSGLAWCETPSQSGCLKAVVENKKYSERALELVCGADFSCKLMFRASPGDLEGPRGRFRQGIPGKPARTFPAKSSQVKEPSRARLPCQVPGKVPPIPIPRVAAGAGSVAKVPSRRPAGTFRCHDMALHLGF